MNPSELIDKQIQKFPDWRGKTMKYLRKLIKSSDPKLVEDWKWSTAVWVYNGPVCATSAFKSHVKLNFFKGAALKDPHKLLNSGFESKQHRSIDLKEGDTINEKFLRDLIKQAVALNN